MASWFSFSSAARAAGFAAGWAGFTMLLALATRPMKLGPGFSNLIPYAVAAILMSGAGHLARHWLNQAHGGAGMENGRGIRGFAMAWVRGLLLFFKGTAAFNNFLFLSIAYFLGIGLTSLFVRGKDGKKPEAGSESHWRDLNLGKREADAYYRPF
jgi:hypothetical protein